MTFSINSKGLVIASEKGKLPWHEARKRMLKAVEMLKKYEITI